MRKTLLGLAVLAGLAFATPALASGHGGIYQSLAVQPLAHNQLQAYSDARADIVQLAKHLLPADAQANTLIGYITDQRAACWGCFLPMSIVAAEWSPFHLPAHAYLAGTHALSERLLLLRGESPEVQALQLRLVADGGTALCQYSALAFRTDTVVGPDWKRLPDVPIEGLKLLAMFGIVLAYARYRRRFWPA